MPSFTFPSLDDGNMKEVQTANIYELANSIFKDPLYDFTLSQYFEKNPRDSFGSLVDGVDYEKAEYTFTSVNKANMGVSVIRHTENFYLLLKYGPHSNSHSHFDKGSIVLYKVKI
jgi:hypothetical protein